MYQLPTPEPIDVVAELLTRYSPAGIVDLCQRIAAQTERAGQPQWSWQLQEVARLALAVEDWLSTHKDSNHVSHD